jgi:sterol 14-demethylase
VGAFRIVIDRELCQGHGVCMGEAPQLFRLVETDSPYLQSEVISAQPLTQQRDLAEQAARFCPNRAITVLDAD